MDRGLAELLMRKLLALSEPLNSIAETIERTTDEAEKAVLRKGIAEIMGRVYTDLELPIIKQHPDLDPDRE
jgi:hypothetical protein